MKKCLHIIKNHVFAGLHHGVGLSDAEVDPCSVDRALALGCGLIFAGQFEMLLEITNTLLYKLLLVVEQTELEGSVSLRLSFVLSLCDVHKFTQVMNRHLHVVVLGVHVGQEFMGLAFFVAGARFKFSLTNLQEALQARNSFI